MTEAGVEKKNIFPINFEELTQVGVKLKRKDLANKLEPFIFEGDGQQYKIVHIKKEDKRSSQFGELDALVVFNSKNEFIGAVTGERYTKWFDSKPPKDDGWASIFLETKNVVDSRGKTYNALNSEIALNITSSHQIHAVRKDSSQQMSGLIRQINSQNFANLLKDTHLAKNVHIQVENVTNGNSAQFCQSCHKIPNQPQASIQNRANSMN